MNVRLLSCDSALQNLAGEAVAPEMTLRVEYEPRVSADHLGNELGVIDDEDSEIGSSKGICVEINERQRKFRSENFGNVRVAAEDFGPHGLQTFRYRQ